MVIHDLFDKDITVKRMSEISSNKTAYTTATTSVPGHRQNLTEEEAQLIDGATIKDYKLWVDVDANILEGDRVKIKDHRTGNVTQELEVLTVEHKDYGFAQNPHKEVIAKDLDRG